MLTYLAKEQKLLLDTSNAFAKTNNIKKALCDIAEYTADTFDISTVRFYYCNEIKKEAEMISEYNAVKDDVCESNISSVFKFKTHPLLSACISEKVPKAFYVDDPNLEKKYIKIMKQNNVMTSLNVPVVYQRKTIGMLVLEESSHVHNFNKKDINTVTTVANQTAMALNNAQILTEIEQRNIELSTIVKAVETVTSTTSITTLLTSLCRHLANALQVSSTEIYYYYEEDEVFELEAEILLEGGPNLPIYDPSSTEGDIYYKGEMSFLDQCISKRKPIIAYIDDPLLDKRARAEMDKWQEKTLGTFPIIYKTKLIGVVSLSEHRAIRRFSKEDIHLVNTIVSSCAAAIETANLVWSEQIEKKRIALVNKRLHSIVELSGKYRELSNEKDILKLFGRYMLRVMGFKQVFVYFYDKKTHQFKITAANGKIRVTHLSDIQKSVPAYVFQNVINMATPVSNSLLLQHDRQQLKKDELKHFPESFTVKNKGIEWKVYDRLFIPLISDENEVIGYTEVHGLEDDEKPSTDFVDLLELFTTRMVSEVNLRRLHRELKDQAITDSLTGLYNRRYMIRRLENDLAYAQRYKKHLAILMIDIDDFKEFNDTYGHPQGDILLADIAEILNSVIRVKVDMVARYGGEEFLIMLARAHADSVQPISQRLLKKVAKHSMKIKGIKKEVSVTISIGASYFPKHGDNASKLIAKADEALYEAKNSGKNCLKIAAPGKK